MKKTCFLKSFVSAAFVIFLVVFPLSSCATRSYGNKSIDINDLASSIADCCSFKDSLYPVPEQLISYYYVFDCEVKTVMYKGNGSTSEEITVIETIDISNVDNVMKVCRDYIEAQAKIYDSYNALEASRLRESYIKSYGRYIIVCVSEDTAMVDSFVQNYFS